MRVGGRRAVARRLGPAEEEIAVLVLVSRHGRAHFECLFAFDLTEW